MKKPICEQYRRHAKLNAKAKKEPKDYRTNLLKIDGQKLIKGSKIIITGQPYHYKIVKGKRKRVYTSNGVYKVNKVN